MDFEKIVSYIVEKSNLTREEVYRRIKEYQEEFRGFLNPEGAAYVLASELGIELPKPSTSEVILSINKLIPGMRRIRVAGRVVRIYPVTSFTRKDGSVGFRREIKIADETGYAYIVVWAPKEALETIDFEEGDVIKVIGGRVRVNSRNEKVIHIDPSSGRIVPYEGDTSKFPKVEIPKLKVSEISSEIAEVDVTGTVVFVSDVKSFERPDGREGRMLYAILEDNTQQVRAVFWRKAVEGAVNLKIGDRILIRSARIRRSVDGNFEVHAGSRSSVKIISYGESEELEFRKLSEIRGNMQYVNVKAVLLKKFEVIPYTQRDGSSSEMLELLLGDDTAVVRGYAWGEAARRIKEMDVPTLLEIRGARARIEGENVAIHIGKNVSITELPLDKDYKIVTVSEDNLYPRKWLGELSEGFYEVRGTVVYVSDSLSITRFCKKCGAHTSYEYGRHVCPKCGKVEDVEYLPSFFIVIDDGTGSIKVSFFRDIAEEIVGKTVEQMLTEIDQLGFQPFRYPLDALREKLLGKEVIVRGKIRFKGDIQAFTMRGKDLRYASPIAEAKMLISEIEGKLLPEIKRRLEENE